jgi:hypothetical protein
MEQISGEPIMTDLQEKSNQLTGRNGQQRVGREPEGKARPIFTPDEIAQLYAPFPLPAHSIREGYKNKAKTRVRWFVYLDRIAIQRRLDELFPGEWEFSVNEIFRAEHYVNITATLTIRGISRTFNGGQSEPANSKSDPENLEKGAMTDTFRRCASLWGFGAYINDGVDIYTAGYAEDNWNEHQQREVEAKKIFQSWYNNQFGPEPKSDSPTPPAEKPEEPDAPSVTYNEQEVIDQVTFMYDHGKHAFNSVKAMIDTGEIEPTDTTRAAVWKVFLHRALSKPLNFPEPKVMEALTAFRESEGSRVPVAKVSQFVADGGTLEQAWQAVKAYKALEDSPPATAKTGTTEDVPF